MDTITEPSIPPLRPTNDAGLRIAMLAPIAWRTPPTHYGPWEQVASALTEGLVRRGVDVTLYATGDSVTSARLEWVAPHGYAEDSTMDGRVWEALHIAKAIRESGEYDLVHSHLDWLPLALDAQWQAPLVTTVHGFSGAGILPAYERSRSALVSISDADRAPSLTYAATIGHGLDVDDFPAGPGGDHLLSFGRIHPDKGVADAIDIAARAGRRLVIAGIVHDEDYFRERIRPHIDDDRVVYLGPVGVAERPAVLGEAAALLHPIHFDEPFGLAVIEAMACGTPVVAYRRGSMPEVVDDGVTGVLVDPANGVVDAGDAVERAVLLDRTVVRDRARERFGIDRMVDAYLDLYYAVLDTADPRRIPRMRTEREGTSL